MSVVDDAIEFLEDLVMGDFKENPSNMSIIANAVIGLIPIADQVLDVRDVAGMVCRITNKGPANCTIDDWVDLSFAAIGCIPEVGSLFKGVFKPLWKSRKVVKKIDAKTWSSIDRMLGMSKGSSIKYLKTFPWAQRKAQALQQLNIAFNSLDQLLAYLSVPRWWVPDNLELLARRMRPQVKKVRDPIKKGFDMGFKAMQDFVIDMIGEEGYKVVNAAATIALSTGNKAKNSHEKSKVKLVGNNTQKKVNSGSTASKKVDNKVKSSKVADKNVDAKKQDVDKKKIGGEKRADHDKVNSNERQTVEKGTGNRVNATQHTIDKIGDFTNKLKGILGEHMADYHCQQIKGWGKDTAKHDGANAINSHKLNDGGKMVQLLEIKSRGRGIDGVWKTNTGKPYAIIEAKLSENPIKSLGELLNDAKDKNGADLQTEQKRRQGQSQKQKKQKNKNSTTNSKGGSLDVGGERSRKDNGKVMQMSHNWIQTRLRSTRLVLNDLFAKEDLLSDTNKVYSRCVLFFSIPQIGSHLTALAQRASGEKINHEIHIAHEVTREWGDAAIAKEADNKAKVFDKSRDKRIR
ncbi:hypothetical protein [Acinetobacter dispersus]|uniref:hypothetical protein n=1 Tax=Acinetobacter dispersus TaxID=70348 RepID=UPI0030081DDB